ncbi:hydroxylase [Subtercola boreus]|uniref:Hydroxylase n=1 Tax=Subtercola boreus TaxID=120213 RepID=A0A3E0VEU0_9MICO|nr:fumarylacetoacetate hydrolase family protein [Subtercola boreus]RFA08179.1 hydroxylase [Subtercola boreus]TQL54930.1 2-keto-4-pentenoate hydratase/2-oxohepta-3-ene-1,7-dioic acid hydratase in catechol pathway [Subtercola boreus]
MRIARWTVSGQPGAVGEDVAGEGFVIGSRVVEFPRGLTVGAVLHGGLALAAELHAEVEREAAPGRSLAEAGRSLAEVQLLAPLVPSSIRDFVAFEEHVEGVSASVDGKSEVVPEWYEAPTFYFTNPHTVLGPDEPVCPPVTERLDFELEVAAVIGGDGGTNLTPAEAGGAIFGYTVMNDWSARDLQSREMKVRLGPAKGKDFGTSLGPWIVTADELEPYLDADGFLAVRAEVRVNDELVGEDLVSNMGWPFGDLVAYASRNSRVVAGDVLGSGTTGNGGCLSELWGRRGDLTPAPLREGDVVRMTVEGVGELVSIVGAASPAPIIPPARVRSRARTRGANR